MISIQLYSVKRDCTDDLNSQITLKNFHNTNLPSGLLLVPFPLPVCLPKGADIMPENHPCLCIDHPEFAHLYLLTSKVIWLLEKCFPGYRITFFVRDCYFRLPSIIFPIIRGRSVFRSRTPEDRPAFGTIIRAWRGGTAGTAGVKVKLPFALGTSQHFH